MSLVNDVLRDLDERSRRGIDVHATTARGIGEAGTNAHGLPIERSRSVRSTFALISVVLACVGLGGTALLYHERTTAQLRSEAAVSPAPRPSTASATSSSSADPPRAPVLVGGGDSAPPSLRPDGAAETAPPPRRSRSTAAMRPRYIQPMTRDDASSSALPDAGEAGTSSAPDEPSAPSLGDEGARAPAARNGAADPRKRAPVAVPGPDEPSFIEVTPRTPSAEERLLMDYHAAADAYGAGALDDAERLLQDLLGRDRSRHRARLLLARLHEDQGRDERAEAVLTQGLLQYPRHAPYASSYARLLARQGRDGAAIATLRNALPNAQGSAELHALLAGLYQRIGDPSAAAESYLAALQLDATAGEWWMGLGLSSEQAGDRQMAEEAYRRALRLRLSGELERYVRLRLGELVAGKTEGDDPRGKTDLES